MTLQRLSHACRCVGVLLLALLAVSPGKAQVPATAEAFLRNTGGATGQSPDAAMDAVVSQIPADVLQVGYTDDAVYVDTTGVPSFETGPYPDANPAIASDVNTIYEIPRAPSYDNGDEPTELGLGAMGIFVNGVALFNAEDGVTYNNQGVWHRNAILAEGDGFDACGGHPAPIQGGGTLGGFSAGIYHLHRVSPCLLAQVGDDGSDHSPIIGFAADGFPVYGPYGFDNPDDPNSPIVRMESSYRERNISERTNLPDGTVLEPAFYGPPVAAGGQYQIGWYIEDFEYDPSSGDLDEHNGRFGVTPEYPEGTYAYRVTIDANGDAAFPYYLGGAFRGIVHSGVDCSGFGETWGPGIGPPPGDCEPGGAGVGVSTVDEIPADAVIYVPEPHALPLSAAAHGTLGLLIVLGRLAAVRSAKQ